MHLKTQLGSHAVAQKLDDNSRRPAQTYLNVPKRSIVGQPTPQI